MIANIVHSWQHRFDTFNTASLDVMEPTAMYEEIAISFPPMWPQDPSWNWVNVHDGQEFKREVFSEILNRVLASTEVIVLVHSNPGVAWKLPKEAVVEYITKFIQKCDIQVTDAQFNRFVSVSSNGLATADI